LSAKKKKRKKKNTTQKQPPGQTHSPQWKPNTRGGGQKTNFEKTGGKFNDRQKLKKTRKDKKSKPTQGKPGRSSEKKKHTGRQGTGDFKEWETAQTSKPERGKGTRFFVWNLKGPVATTGKQGGGARGGGRGKTQRLTGSEKGKQKTQVTAPHTGPNEREKTTINGKGG